VSQGGGAGTVGCQTVKNELLGPIDAVSLGEVEDISGASAPTVTLRVDASAGGHMAAAMNPYIYVKLEDGTRAELTDLAADSSVAWDLALKRDNLRMNGGDSGPGDGAVAVLDGVDFDAVTADAATGANFGVDDFVNDATCELMVDAVGKPLTRFDGWYDYGGAAMTLTPAAKVFLIRNAEGTQLYKLQILGYYQELSDGAGGTVKKSAVYTLRYAAL